MKKKIGKLLFKMRRRFFGEPAPRVSVLSLNGVIGGGGRFKQSLNMASVADRIDEAFAVQGLSAVALNINSPGGSPVQSTLIVKRIRALADEKNIPVLAFAEDVAASGGYMLALAGDEIYADESSLIGSIGVIAGGFGFSEAIKKLGVERRIYTAGEKKAMLDSFSEEKEDEVEWLKAMQAEIHENFKKMVRDRRGKRLKGLRGKIFSGEVFTGTEAVKLGLIDGIGDVRAMLRDRFGEKVVIKDIGEKKTRLGALFGLEQRSRGAANVEISADLAPSLISALEERLQWNKFGL